MAIRYDDYVKRPNEELEYTPDQIQELMKCKDDILYFCKHYVKIVTLDFGEVPFEPYEYQLETIKLLDENRFFIGLWARQSGKTTIVAAYALHYAIFNPNKNVGIVSNKESSAKRILDTMKRMYEALPVWLKPGVTEYQKTSVHFDNGTNLIISATTSDAFRGWPMNMVICDEFAFVPSNQAEEFWAANYPTISSSKKSKLIIISTPNGMFNIFHRLWTQAVVKDNAFVPYKVIWDKVPGRDKEWAKTEIANMGMQAFNQEYACKFLGSTNTVIHPECLRTLMSMHEEPIFYDLQDRLRLWEKPKDGARYIMGVDPAKGTGENSSGIQICRIDSVIPVQLEQIAVFEDNLTDVYEFAQIINKLSYYFNNAYIMCENNGEGAAVITQLWHSFENENLVNSGSKEKSLGVRSQKDTKPKAVLLMKKLIEDGSVKLRDKETIEQLGSFIEEKNKFFGKDKPDDLVCALFWGTYLFQMDILDEDWQFKNSQMDKNDAWGILSDIEDDIDDWSWLTKSSLWE